jgi:hypothetical protein
MSRIAGPAPARRKLRSWPWMETCSSSVCTDALSIRRSNQMGQRPNERLGCQVCCSLGGPVASTKSAAPRGSLTIRYYRELLGAGQVAARPRRSGSFRTTISERGSSGPDRSESPWVNWKTLRRGCLVTLHGCSQPRQIDGLGWAGVLDLPIARHENLPKLIFGIREWRRRCLIRTGRTCRFAFRT